MPNFAPERWAMPVHRGEEQRAFKKVESFSSKRERIHKTINWALAAACAVLLFIDAALAVALAFTLPTVRLVPAFYPVQSDGSIDPPKAINALASDYSEQAIRSEALQLVNACEGYIFSDAQYRYDLCSLMLVGHLKQEYQARWFLPNHKPNPESNPQVLYPKGKITIEKISIEVGRGHVAEMRFRRIVDLDTEAPVDRRTCKEPVCTTWTATIDFMPAEKMTQEVRDLVPWGLVAVRYSLSEGKL
jgi:type IV secretory pathway component VirB8